MIVLVSLGLMLKPSAKTQADSLDTPATEAKKPQASSTARILQRQKQVRQIRAENYNLDQFPINANAEDHWRHLLWTTAVVEPREPFVAETLNQILQMTNRAGLSDSQVRTIDQAMKVSTQLYLSDPSFYGSMGQRFVETIEQSPDPEWVAVALSGLAKGKLSIGELARLSRLVKTRFPGWETNIFLQTTLQEIADAEDGNSTPPLKDLLTWEVAPNQLHLYVLCRRDRRVLCRTVLKDRNGKFVQQGGKLWSMPLLLESIHDLGWNFTRGQTPQGIFRIEGVVPQPDDEFFRAYGQFSLVNLYVPFEAGAKAGFGGSLDSYKSLLPSSWRNHRPIQQSYWAGKAGRGLFRIHGSGEAVDFFRGKDRNFPESFNWNPTIGCLSARELYNEKGQLIHADMPKLLKNLQMLGGKNFTGYLVVVDLPASEPAPVSLKTIEEAIDQSHRQAAKPRRKQVVAARRASFTPSKTVLIQSVEASRQVRLQVAKLATELERLGTGTTSPQATPLKATKTSSALKPIPIAY